MHKLLMLAALAVSIPAVAQADPIIVNPGFELGNTGFTSGYQYEPLSPNALVPPGTYSVGSGSSAFNPNWTQNVTAHSGNEFMIVNGDQTAGTVVYDQTGIAVMANTQYFFSAWVTALTPFNEADLQFSINGVALGNAPLLLSTSVGTWEELFVPWFSGSDTMAEISLINENTTFSGNDFGLDDIALSTTSPVPEPLTLSIFGAGLAGVAGVVALRRKKKA